MAKCFRCGSELTQPKCDSCGFQPQNGVRLLTKWTGKYEFPKVEPEVPTGASTTRSQSSGAASVVGATQQTVKPQTVAGQATANRPTTGQSATARPSGSQTGTSRTNGSSIERMHRRINWEIRIESIIKSVVALAVLAGLIFGGIHLVRWARGFSGYTWRLIGASVLAMLIPTVTIILAERVKYGIDEVSEYIVVPILSVINFVLMIIFPDIYRPMGAVIALGLGVSFAYLAYKLLDFFEPVQGAVCAVFMIANLLLFPHLWGISWLGYVLYVVIVLVCAGLAALFVSNDWTNPVVLQIVFAGIAVVFYLVGFLAMPHFMHALNGMPEFSEERYVGQEKVEAECFCGDTLEMNPFTEDMIHGLHCVLKFVFIPECEGDETGHWQICTCGETYHYQKHAWNDEGICGFCKFPGEGIEMGGETETPTEGTTEEGTTEEGTTEEGTTEDEPTQGGTEEQPPVDSQDKSISIRTIAIIGSVVLVFYIVLMVIVYHVYQNRRTTGGMYQAPTGDLIVNLTITGVYAVTVLTVVVCAWSHAAKFGLSTMHILIGLGTAVVVAAAMMISSVVSQDYAGQMISGIVLSILNMAAMFIFSDKYWTIGAVAAGGLAVTFAFLTYAAFYDWENASGGINAVFMGINFLLLFTIFGISFMGWVVLAITVILWIIVTVICSSSFHNSIELQSIFVGACLVATLCGYLFAPHYMHSFHRLPEPYDQNSAAETTVGAECICGELVGLSVGKAEWIHSLHCLKAGGTAEIGHNTREHWMVCVCGARYTCKEHVYDENGVCVDCSHIEGEGVDDGEFTATYDENSDRYVITGYRGESTHFLIPGLYNGKTVVIGEHAIENNQVLYEVVASEGVTSIGANAFKGCTSLTTVLIGSVEEIGEAAFMRCVSLKSIELPNSLTVLEAGAFSGSGLTHVELPSSLTTVGVYAFASCEELESVGISGSMKQINVGAFNDCPKLSAIYFHGNREQWDAIIWTEKAQYEAIVYFME